MMPDKKVGLSINHKNYLFNREGITNTPTHHEDSIPINKAS